MAISEEKLNRIRKYFTEEELFKLYPATSRMFYDKDPLHQKKRDVILLFLNGQIEMKDLVDQHRTILRILATLCLKVYREFAGGKKRESDGVIKIEARDFETFLKYFSYFKLGRDGVKRFKDSYSWTIVNKDGCPGIYYNESKLGDNKIKEDREFHLAAWLLHEITHVLVHWSYFENRTWTDLQEEERGGELEKQAWEGAIQLLELLYDQNCIQDFLDPGKNSTELFNRIIGIFQEYKEEDINRAKI